MLSSLSKLNPPGPAVMRSHTSIDSVGDAVPVGSIKLRVGDVVIAGAANAFDIAIKDPSTRPDNRGKNACFMCIPLMYPCSPGRVAAL